MPLTMPTCSASASELALYLILRSEAFELACYLATRSHTFHKKSFFACLSVTSLCVVLVPLFVTNTLSYGAATRVCHDWTVTRKNVTRFDVDSQYYDPEWDMDDAADWHLLPVHLFNSISTAVSLFGFGIWLFFSPHERKHDPLSTAVNTAQDLDLARTETCICVFICL